MGVQPRRPDGTRPQHDGGRWWQTALALIGIAVVVLLVANGCADWMIWASEHQR